MFDVISVFDVVSENSKWRAHHIKYNTKYKSIAKMHADCSDILYFNDLSIANARVSELLVTHIISQ